MALDERLEQVTRLSQNIKTSQSWRKQPGSIDTKQTASHILDTGHNGELANLTDIFWFRRDNVTIHITLSLEDLSHTFLWNK